METLSMNISTVTCSCVHKREWVVTSLEETKCSSLFVSLSAYREPFKNCELGYNCEFLG